jgi:N-acetylneuraminate synthase
LGAREIGPGSKPYLIAEIGVNHGGSLEKAKELVRLAKEGGADAAKFQTYKAEKLTVRNSPAYWDLNAEKTTSQFELFKKFDALGPDDYLALHAYCKEIGIEFSSTPFDLEAVELLDPLCSFYKVASADVTNIPLLRAIGRKRKPIVLSTGASNLAEVDTAIRILENAGADDIVVMQCTLNYPCDYQHANLAMIGDLQRVFHGRVIGYSDHTLPNEDMSVLTSAWLLGAVVLEKHFTFDKTLPGNDHYHAMDADDVRRFRAKCDFVDSLLGSSAKRALPEEEPARRHARRSIVAARNLAPGTLLTELDLVTKRPGTGIPASEWDNIVGKTTVRAVEEDQVLAWSDIS